MLQYVPTAKEAWERHLKECQDSVPACERQLEEAKKQLKYIKWEVERVAAILKTL